MRSTAIKTISCIFIYNQFTISGLPQLFSCYKIIWSILHSTPFLNPVCFCLPTKPLHTLAVTPVCYVTLIINYLSYQLTRTLLDNSGPISEDGNTMSGQLKTSRWNVLLFANPYLNPKPTKNKTSLSKKVLLVYQIYVHSLWRSSTLYVYLENI